MSPGTATVVLRLWSWSALPRGPSYQGSTGEGHVGLCLDMVNRLHPLPPFLESSPRQWPSPVSQDVAHRWFFVSIWGLNNPLTHHYHFNHLKPVHLLIALIQPTELPFGVSYYRPTAWYLSSQENVLLPHHLFRPTQLRFSRGGIGTQVYRTLGFPPNSVPFQDTCSHQADHQFRGLQTHSLSPDPLESKFLKVPSWKFPGSPVVRTLSFHCWGPSFDPWLRN